MYQQSPTKSLDISSFIGINKSLRHTTGTGDKRAILFGLDGCVIDNSSKISKPPVMSKVFSSGDDKSINGIIVHNDRVFCSINECLFEIEDGVATLVFEGFGAGRVSSATFGDNTYATDGSVAIIISDDAIALWTVFPVTLAESDNRDFFIPSQISCICVHGSMLVVSSGQHIYFSEPWAGRLFDKKNFVSIGRDCLGLESIGGSLLAFSNEMISVFSGLSLYEMTQRNSRILGRYIGHTFVDPMLGFVAKFTGESTNAIAMKTDRALYMIGDTCLAVEVTSDMDVDFNQSIPFFVDGFLAF